jgi:hypothetical protein
MGLEQVQYPSQTLILRDFCVNAQRQMAMRRINDIEAEASRFGTRLAWNCRPEQLLKRVCPNRMGLFAICF